MLLQRLAVEMAVEQFRPESIELVFNLSAGALVVSFSSLFFSVSFFLSLVSLALTCSLTRLLSLSLSFVFLLLRHFF